jgi:hypothetical protein
LNWRLVCKVLPAFPVLEELFLCKNDMRDYENIGSVENLKYLKLLNLENTLLEDIEGLKEPILYKIKTL